MKKNQMKRKIIKIIIKYKMTDNQIKDNEIKLEDVEEFVWRWKNHKKNVRYNI